MFVGFLLKLNVGGCCCCDSGGDKVVAIILMAEKTLMEKMTKRWELGKIRDGSERGSFYFLYFFKERIIN